MPKSSNYNFLLYKRLLGYLRGYWKVFALSLITMAIAAATEPAFARLLKYLVDGGFVEKDQHTMIWVPLAIIALFFVRGICSFTNDYSTSWLSGHLVQNLRQQMFANLMRLPVNYYDEHPSGRILSRITYEVNQITEAGFDLITITVKDGIKVVGLFALLFYTDWRLTLICLAVFPIVTLCVKYVARRLRALSQQNQLHMAQLTQVLTESVDSQRMVKIYSGENYESARFNNAARSLRQNEVKQTATSSLSTGFTQLIIACALSAVLYFAALRARQNAMTAGDFMSFLSSMLLLFPPIKRITNITRALQRGLASAESVFSFLDEPLEVDSGTHKLSKTSGEISFEKVCFRYANAERDALSNLTLNIESGQSVALVGASGSGKTTLASLIPRFYLPSSGTIRIDGIALNDITLSSLRDKIALVSQDVILFDDTVGANIAYSRLGEVSEEEIIEAARAANALEFIEQLPEKFNTRIGENGLRLSGGQRQRLAIARALLKNAPILILDEATSALDTQSERLVQKALDTLMQNRTTIVIAHRLSTIENADKIMVMQQGKIAETGTHASLMKQGGLYANLHKTQFVETNQSS